MNIRINHPRWHPSLGARARTWNREVISGPILSYFHDSRAGLDHLGGVPCRLTASELFPRLDERHIQNQKSFCNLPITPMRHPSIHHVTSIPYQFFGRRRELNALDLALTGESPSVIAMVGPGGQGKTAIVQHWLESLASRHEKFDGLFLWSFYRGKDSDLCLRTLFAYAEGRDDLPEVSASFCVDRLLPLLRSERWAIVLDGAEVVHIPEGKGT